MPRPSVSPVFRSGRGCSPPAVFRISQYGVESGQMTVTRSRYTRSREEIRGGRIRARRDEGKRQVGAVAERRDR